MMLLNIWILTQSQSHNIWFTIWQQEDWNYPKQNLEIKRSRFIVFFHLSITTPLTVLLAYQLLRAWWLDAGEFSLFVSLHPRRFVEAQNCPSISLPREPT